MPRPFRMRPPDKPSKVVHLPNPILGYKVVEFGYHALERMEQRNVSEEGCPQSLGCRQTGPRATATGKDADSLEQNGSITNRCCL